MMLILLLSVMCSGIGAFAEDDSIHVVFVNPAAQGYWFWDMVTDFMQAAADDLGIELEVMYNVKDWDHFLPGRQAKEVVSRTTPPDYLLTGNEKGSAGRVIEAAQEAGVKVFLFNNGFVNPKDVEQFDQPRTTYPMWIGQFIPNNFSAGYQIGKVLIVQGLVQGLTAPDGTLHLVALAGTFNTHSSVERVRGLKAVVQEYVDQVTLLQVVPGDWTEQTATIKSQGVFHRYEHIGAVWGVNDVTAFGAMTSAVKIGKRPGIDMLFGGCGWYDPAIEKVKEGTLATTVGGHFMDGAWVLVMLYDYHHGKDFMGDPCEPTMFSLDHHNVDQYIEVFGTQEWEKIDFTRFSKVLNPSLTTYDFSLDAVLKQFE